MKRKSKYTMTQNIAWMIGNAWRICKSVLTLCVLCAAAAVAVNLTELFVAPQILSKVEQAAPVAELIGTILLFTVLLFLAKGLKSYLALNTLYGRVEVRTGLINQVEYKNNTTSYPNTLDPERIKMYKGASHAMSGNAEPSEHIWETMTLLLGDIAGFAIYLLLLVRVEPVMMAVVMVTTLVSYLVARRTSSWNFAHREEERQRTSASLGWAAGSRQSTTAPCGCMKALSCVGSGCSCWATWRTLRSALPETGWLTGIF